MHLILTEIPLEFHMGPIHIKSTLVQVMALYRIGESPELMMAKFIDASMLQWAPMCWQVWQVCYYNAGLSENWSWRCPRLTLIYSYPILLTVRDIDGAINNIISIHPSCFCIDRFDYVLPIPCTQAIRTSQIAKLMGPTWAHLGPVGPRWAPCWPHESCYQGCLKLGLLMSQYLTVPGH